ncbi:MAG: carboxypeptidase regulatory-like domain-containing protein [Myxococcaceae bacterium]|nr:carboxypeptidase regulatory-like domain-containing protein [Myxococcaceae bacterium]
MKSLAALAAVCLLGAVVYAGAPPGEGVPTFEPAAPAAEAPTVVFEPQPEPFEAMTSALALAAPPEPAQVEPGDLADSAMLLTGRVTPRSGTQPDVTVLAQSECPNKDEDCAVELVETQADPETGEFTIEIGPGRWRLVARAEGFLPAAEEGLTLAPGEVLGDIVMLLERGDRITGRVFHEGEPLESIGVVAMADGWVRTATTDALGRYELVGLPPGEYTVQAHGGHFGGDEKRAKTGTTVDLDLGHREKVRGRVVDARGMPVEGAAIYSDFDEITRSDSDPLPNTDAALIGLGAHGCAPSPACYQRAVTGPDGRFEVSAAPGEQLVLGARAGTRFALADALNPGDDVTLELREPRQLRVVDADRNPVEGAELEIAPFQRFFGAPLPSNENGIVEVPDLGDLSLTPPAQLYIEGEGEAPPWSLPVPPRRVPYEILIE